MTVHLVTFADESMSRSAALCVESAKRNGVENVNRYYPPNVPDDDCVSLMEKWPRGRGYWSWKPAIIGAEMGIRCVEGDVLIYADAGVEFIDNVNYIIDRMDEDIFLFGNNYQHAHWCKRDVIDAVWPTTTKDLRGLSQDGSFQSAWRRYGRQCQASVIFFRVSDYSRKFVKEWLDWCLYEGGRLIDDSPSRAPNHPEFREHRHDQAILTTLAYREGIKLHYWPASYNDGAFTYEKLPEYVGDDYPILFHHHRRRNHEWEQVA